MNKLKRTFNRAKITFANHTKSIITIGLFLLLIEVVALTYASTAVFNEIQAPSIVSNEILISYNTDQTQATIESNTVVSNVTKEEHTTYLPTTNEPGIYYIKVNNTAQVVTVYTLDENNEYTIPIKAMICSTGISTPASGVYNTSNTKYVWHSLFGNVYGQYSTQIVGNILFHSVPYAEKYNHASLIPEYYDDLGSEASAGCVRLTVEDSKWIHDNCLSGTFVEFYEDINPGPLGSPSATKISGAEGDLKYWDPTDPDEKNPWNQYNNITI